PCGQQHAAADGEGEPRQRDDHSEQGDPGVGAPARSLVRHDRSLIVFMIMVVGALLALRETRGRTFGQSPSGAPASGSLAGVRGLLRDAGGSRRNAALTWISCVAAAGSSGREASPPAAPAAGSGRSAFSFSAAIMSDITRPNALRGCPSSEISGV